MTTGEAARGAGESLHDWLMSDRPRSRRQAAFGRAYGTWRTSFAIGSLWRASSSCAVSC